MKGHGDLGRWVGGKLPATGLLLSIPQELGAALVAVFL